MASSDGSSSGEGGKPNGSGSSDGGNSDGDSSDVSAMLYKAWMTGFSYEACRNLYKPGGLPAQSTDEEVRDYRDKVLPWLSTYLNLVSEWCATGLDVVTDDLQQMVKDVRGHADPSTSASTRAGHSEGTTKRDARRSADADDKFDSDFDLVLGAIRAKEPYGCYATLAGEYSSRLTHLRDGDTLPALAGAIRDNLCEMQNVLPDGAYEVIDSDLSKIESGTQVGMVNELEKDIEGSIEPRDKERRANAEKPRKGRSRAESPATKKMLNQEIATWTDLIFGVSTPEGILSARGRALAYTLVVAVGLGLILGIGLVILLVLKVVANIPGIDLSSMSLGSGNSFISTVETVSTTLTTVGLSFGLLVTKAWDSLQAFERTVLLSFAKTPRFRRHVRPVYAQ